MSAPEIISGKLADIEARARFGLVSRNDVEWLIITLRGKMAELVMLKHETARACKDIAKLAVDIQRISIGGK